jgi:hypothetical protein
MKRQTPEQPSGSWRSRGEFLKEYLVGHRLSITQYFRSGEISYSFMSLGECLSGIAGKYRVKGRAEKVALWQSLIAEFSLMIEQHAVKHL